LTPFQLRRSGFGNKGAPFARTGKGVNLLCQIGRQFQPNVLFLQGHIPFIGSKNPQSAIQLLWGTSD
jgi:hypothetical protein